MTRSKIFGKKFFKMNGAWPILVKNFSKNPSNFKQILYIFLHLSFILFFHNIFDYVCTSIMDENDIYTGTNKSLKRPLHDPRFLPTNEEALIALSGHEKNAGNTWHHVVIWLNTTCAPLCRGQHE